MSLMVPGRGWCTHVYRTGVNVDYALLGPFSEDTWLDRLDVTAMVGASMILQMGFSMGGSGEGSVGAFRAGLSLVQRSPVSFEEQPAIGWNAGLAGSWRFIIPVGVRVSSGSRFVVCRVAGTAAAVTYCVTISARVWAEEQGA